MSLYRHTAPQLHGSAAPSRLPATSSADVTALSSSGMECMQYDPHTNTPPLPWAAHSCRSSCTLEMLHNGRWNSEEARMQSLRMGRTGFHVWNSCVC